MKHSAKQAIINQSPNGIVFTCTSCNKIHIEFKNLNFNFTAKQYDYFVQYFNNLQIEIWEEKNENTLYRRKIIVPIGHHSFNIMLHRLEVIELRQLLNQYQSETKMSEYNVMPYILHPCFLS